MNRTVFALSLLTGLVISSVNAQETKEMKFTATVDSTTQLYVQILPAGFDPSRYHDVMIALHGAGSDRWQFAADTRDECRAARDEAAKHAMIYISPDYRGTSFMGIKAEADVLQIIEETKAKYRVSSVFITGASMGGMGCLTFTVLHPDLIAGVASMNGTGNFFEWPGFDFAPLVESFGGTSTQVPDEYRKRSAEFWPEKFTMPIGIATSGQDNIVPPQSVLRMADTLQKLGKTVRLVYEPTFGHVTNYTDAMIILDFMVDSAENHPPVITSDLKDVTVSECQTATFSVTATPWAFHYVWTRNGVVLASQTERDVVLACPALADDNSRYQCIVSSALGSDTSREATLHVLRDQTAPTILSVYTQDDPNTVTVVFSEKLDPASAQTAGNYAITPSITVSGAVLSANERTITLTTTTALSVGANYVLTVNNVTDRASSPHAVAPNSAGTFQFHPQLPNHDFETGDLTGWTVLSGDAFTDSNVTRALTTFNGLWFNQHGDYHLYGNIWGADGHAVEGDARIGVMRSADFTVTGDGAIDFLLGGGCNSSLYVALVRNDDGRVLLKKSPDCSETYAHTVWDASAYIGARCHILVVDSATGPVCHIDLDDVNIAHDDRPPAVVTGGSGRASAQTPAMSMTTDRDGHIVLRNMPARAAARRALVISIVDVAGRLVRHTRTDQLAEVADGHAGVRLTCGRLPAGCYIVKATADGGSVLGQCMLVRR
jgi:pimeloyl-ACP methyl ester carboxylesterase